MHRLFADDNSLQQLSIDMLDIEYKLNHDLQVVGVASAIQSIKNQFYFSIKGKH
jgi:hypothetical protein